MEENTAKKSGKKLWKRIFGIAVSAVQVAVIVACIVLSVMVIVESKSRTETGLSDGINLMPVKSDSMDGDMKGSFKTGDLLIVKSVLKDGQIRKEMLAEIKEGDIVTFLGKVDGRIDYITHRVVEVSHNAENVYYFTTKGDKAVKENIEQTEFFPEGNLRAVCVGKIPAAGSIISFFQDNKWRFFGLIIVPLILLLIYDGVLMMRYILKGKEEKYKSEKEAAVEAATAAALEMLKKSGMLTAAPVAAPDLPAETTTEAAAKPTDAAPPNEEGKDIVLSAEQLAAREEEIKRKAIEEFLASQKKD